MRLLLRLYLNALLNGNPFVVALTIIVAIAVSAGPFYEGLSNRDPAAIGLAALIGVGIALVLTVAIIDRRNDPEYQKKKKKQKQAQQKAIKR